MSRLQKRSNHKIWISVAAMAACLLVIFGTVFAWLSGDGGKQVPVYQGMTVSFEQPLVNTVSSDSYTSAYTMSLGMSWSDVALSVPLNEHNKQYSEPQNTRRGNDLDASVDGRYYALTNEDLYIYVHLSNPDGFEILSFTLNGIKYSSYMFEEGSDMETLILKYNVGDVEGLQQYTIDAIKYVDGEKIKDVRMEGDQTIEVFVNSDNQAVNFNARLNGWDLSIAPQWMFDGGRFTSLAIYDGNQKVGSYSPTTTVFRNLPAGKKLTLIGTYSSGGTTETVAYVFQTPKISEGLIINGGKITGIGSCTDKVLYLNMPIEDGAPVGNYNIEEIYLGNGVTSIGEAAFGGCISLKKVTFNEAVKTIGQGAFSNCTSLESIALPNGLTVLENGLFSACCNLSSVTIGSGVTKVESYSFFKNEVVPGTDELKKVMLNNTFAGCSELSVVTFKGTIQQWNQATAEIDGWELDQSITIRCTNGDVVINPYQF